MSRELPTWVLLLPADVDAARRDVGDLWEDVTGDPIEDIRLDWHAGEGPYCAVTAWDPMLTEADYELSVSLSRMYLEPVFTIRPEEVFEYGETGIDEFSGGEHMASRPGDPFEFAERLGVHLPRPGWLAQP